jgi:hypothetical protein
VIGHLADTDAIFRQRTWLLLETVRPVLPPTHRQVCTVISRLIQVMDAYLMQRGRKP